MIDPDTLSRELAKSRARLDNVGLDSSDSALEAYGDIAAATATAISRGTPGEPHQPFKQLHRLVEAVIDASMNEWQRLKEFGIRRRDSGHDHVFYYRGSQTVVRKSKGAAEEYIQSVGRDHYIGAMDQYMKYGWWTQVS